MAHVRLHGFGLSSSSELSCASLLSSGLSLLALSSASLVQPLLQTVLAVGLGLSKFTANFMSPGFKLRICSCSRFIEVRSATRLDRVGILAFFLAGIPMYSA